jgi:hypothetical protein
MVFVAAKCRHDGGQSTSSATSGCTAPAQIRLFGADQTGGHLALLGISGFSLEGGQMKGSIARTRILLSSACSR